MFNIWKFWWVVLWSFCCGTGGGIGWNGGRGGKTGGGGGLATGGLRDGWGTGGGGGGSNEDGLGPMASFSSSALNIKQ